MDLGVGKSGLSLLICFCSKEVPLWPNRSLSGYAEALWSHGWGSAAERCQPAVGRPFSVILSDHFEVLRGLWKGMRLCAGWIRRQGKGGLTTGSLRLQFLEAVPRDFHRGLRDPLLML